MKWYEIFLFDDAFDLICLRLPKANQIKFIPKAFEIFYAFAMKSKIE